MTTNRSHDEHHPLDVTDDERDLLYDALSDFIDEYPDSTRREMAIDLRRRVPREVPTLG